MSATALDARTDSKVSEKTPHVRHIYCRCTRGNKETRIAFCGHRSGPMFGVIYDPKLPNICIVCTDAHERACTQCGRKL